MKTTLLSSVQLFLIASIVIGWVLASTREIFEENEIYNQVIPNVPEVFLVNHDINRVRRQESNKTAAFKPKKHRPSNIFSLISVLIAETREDANRAFNEIGNLVNAQFVNETISTTTMATSTAATNSSDAEDDEDVSSTTEPFRITRNQFLGVLRSNIQGIVQLFRREFKVALQDSNKNVREFGRDLKNAIWPYFSRGKKNSTGN